MKDRRSSPGLVFDIRRFSLDDGPGIRTSVFLKGCPLHCLWCHNPEGIDRKPRLSFDLHACTLCRKCLMACPNNVHVFDRDTHILDRSGCTACAECVSVCLSGALKMAGKSMTAPEVLAEVMKDKPFYDQSGGGMTLTGGEPLFQADFALELLKEARKEGVHTCVETSGHAATRTFSRAIPFTDIFLYDLKIKDATLHEKYTGVNNTRILNNLHLLNKQKATVYLRCPVIPCINDTRQHFKWLVSILKEIGHAESIELIPFHTYGLSKYVRFGLTQRLPVNCQKPEAGTLLEWQAAFNNILQRASLPFYNNDKQLLWKRK